MLDSSRSSTDSQTVLLVRDTQPHMHSDTSITESPPLQKPADPVQLARALVQKSMLASFATDASVDVRVQLLRDIGQLTRGFARRLLSDPDPRSSAPNATDEPSDASHRDDPYMLPRTSVSPPRAYFALRENGRMFLPLIDWSAFRGYTVALWLNVDVLMAQSRADESDAQATFSLFRFANSSSTLGVEATLTIDCASPKRMVLTVSSCHPSDSNKRGSSSAAAIRSAAANGAAEWKRIAHPVALVPGQWHLLVLAHSLHYVKKSRVTCYVDTSEQFHDELVYPSGLVTASKCTLGGGRGTAVKLASATMYQDELASDMVALLFAQGPMISSFNRYATPPPNAAANYVFGDLHGVAVASSPLAVPYTDLFAAYCKLHVVFCYTAHDLAHEDYADLGVEWLSEGAVSDATARWVTMESTAGVSAEIQQRNARLGKSVSKVVFPDSHAAWHRVIGVTAVPALLHYVLTGYDRVCRASESAGDDVATVLEHIVVDVMWIAKGLLLNSVRDQQEVLQQYVLHVLCHVLVKHRARLQAIWTPQSLVVCVELVQSLHAMLPIRRTEAASPNHPLQASVWTTNPLFASGIRALLLDYRVWAATDVKTQSIYNHQLYRLVCEHPRVFNDMNAVAKVLDILRTFYASSNSASTLSSASSERKKADEWTQQCVQTLVEVLDVCLTHQSVFVHDVRDDEVDETTFARPTTASGSGASTNVGSSSSGTGAAPSTAGSAYATFALPRRQGGVFSINLENIVWSDQPDGAAPHADESESASAHAPAATASAPAPSTIHVRFALVRNVRAIVRFLLTSDDAVVSRALLLLLRRLAVSFLDVRFALLSSNIVDCLLFLMRRPQSSSSDDASSQTARASVAIACVPLLIYFVDWLESIEGRTVWCGLEEHLRLILNGDGSFSLGFLELMMEFYFHPPSLLGAQQSVLMNDASKKDSVLFPISATTKSVVASIHESGILVSDDALNGTSAGNSSDMSGTINGLHEWIQRASQFGGKRLALSWEKRIAVVKLAALRNLVLSTALPRDPAASDNTGASESTSATESAAAAMFDDGVSSILALPLRGVLPFLPVLLSRSSASYRDKVLMDLNVKLKTDDVAQQQLLLMKRGWAEALLELSIACSSHSVDDSEGATDAPALDETEGAGRTHDVGRAYSFDASKTGEDLVLDTIVSLLCVAMHTARGWRSFTDVILALKAIRIKYDRQTQASASSASDTASSSMPVVSALERVTQAELYASSLDWLSRVAGIVLQRMARSRTMLSRTLGENLQKLLHLVHETLLALPLRPSTLSTTTTTPPSTGLSGWLWSDAQLFLLNAVLDMCARLVQSPHKLHRVGLVPGLQILQRALPFVPGKAMMARVIDVLVASFQQEMGLVSALRVYDHVSTRDVFLRALVCLRRALLIQETDDVLDLLRSLVLRITTSGSFIDELQVAGVTVQALSVMTEANAAIVSLDALALAINETEMHEREEEADLVPHFPVAKDLLALQRLATTTTDGPRVRSPSDAYAATLSFVDDAEQVLWAALEVEENRMMEALRDVAEHDRLHVQRAADAYAARRHEWTEKLWVKHEYAFRSQHQHVALKTAAPAALQALERARVFRIGLYETPHPGRMRRTLDVDLTSPSVGGGGGEADESGSTKTASGSRGTVADPRDSSSSTETKAAVTPDASPVTDEAPALRRRQFSLPLDAMHGLDFEVAHQSPLNSPNARVSGSLLERVGRVVAEQRGGEIRDITSDTKGLDVDDDGQVRERAISTGDDDARASETLDSAAVTSLQLAYDAGDDDEDKTPVASHESSPVHLLSASSALKPFASPRDMERQCESGLDPGEGVALTVDDQLVARAVCRRVIPEGIVSGTLFLCNEHLAFEPEAPALPPFVNPTSSSATGADVAATDEAAPGLHRCWRWRYDDIVAVYLRRYRLRDSALEVFLRNGSNHFLDFPLAARHQRNELVRLLYSFLPRSVPKQWPGRGLPSLSATTKAWQTRQISNFEYLMALNTFAGRSFNDLTQYPVFPWVLSNYTSATLDLSDPRNFRDLSKPMGALNPTRLAEYWERYNSFDDPVIPKFLYGSHYSTCAGVVLFFLFRLQPFAELQRRMQGGTFDLPDRLFYSIHETWEMCNSQMSEVKELTPEFFSDASFLRNVNAFALGRRHDQHVVNDVQLPPWAATPEDFVRINRAALESELVSQHLHEWIDLIFGYKQRGKAALRANNVFYYLTYYGVVDLDRIDDPYLRESMELQIAHFGQCPMQLFGTLHPKRNTVAFARRSPAAASVSAAPASAVPVASASGSSHGIGPLTPGTGVTSPGASSSGPGTSRVASSATTTAANIARPLSLSFQDATPSAQEKRRLWSPSVDVKPLVQCAIRLIKILPDRIVTVNDLGVIDLYNWKLVPKPQPPRSQTSGVESALDSALGLTDATTSNLTERAPFVDDSSAIGAAATPFVTSPVPMSGHLTPVGTPLDPASSLTDESAAAKPPAPQCPWLVEVARDDSPFDFIPRMPFHEDHVRSSSASASGPSFPVAISMNGRVLLSGGGRGGALHLRLLDLDTGQIIGKASVTGHDGAITCLSLDRLTHNAAVNQQDEEELVVSGSKDGTLALWRLSRVKPDLLFRLPRISSCPILTLRGHCDAVRDCCVSTFLGLVVSCSERMGVVHYLHSDGQVAFVLEPPLLGRLPNGHSTVFANVRLSMKGFILTVSRELGPASRARSATHDAQDTESAPKSHDTSDEIAAHKVLGVVFQVFTLSGVLLQTHQFPHEDVDDVTLSAEGDLVILTMRPSTIRICRLDEYVRECGSRSLEPWRSCASADCSCWLSLSYYVSSFTVVQEYASPAHVAAPTSATCVGPSEAVVLLASGHSEGTLVLQLLPDADGSVSFLASLRKMLGVSSKLKIVKGTVQQAQNLALTTLGNAKAVTNTARDIAGEALGEAKSIVRGFFTYLQRQSQG